jgi:hypothetical protein
MQSIRRSLLLLLLSQFVCTMTMAESQRATVSVDSRDWDFGVVDEGVILTHEFTIHNAGGATLELSKFRVSCGACLTYDTKPKSIGAGQTGVVSLRLDTKGKRGRCSQKATMITNDPDMSLLVLTCHGMVRGIWTQPDYVSFGNIMWGAHPTTDFFVLSAGFPDAKIKGIESSCNAFDITVGPASGDQRIKAKDITTLARIEMKWRDNTRSIGQFSSTITVHTDVGRYPIIKVPASAYLFGSFEPRPQKIFFGRVLGSQTVNRTCTLIWHGDHDMPDPNELEMTIEHDFITGQLCPIKGNGKQILLHATLKNARATTAESALLEGAIVFKRNNEPVLSVPYLVYLGPDRSMADNKTATEPEAPSD